jgi:hypothetical protein
MSMMKYATAMLAPTACGRMPERLGLSVVATLGALAAASSASAVEYYATWTNTTYDFSDSFDLTFSSANPGVGADYSVTNESGDYGSTDLDFNLVSYNGGLTDLVNANTYANVKFEIFNPSPYAGDPSGALDPGVYSGNFGSTLSISAVPEPEAWALIVVGAGLAGGALRSRRRRVASPA